MVERLHRTLKQALKCYNNNRWTLTLPLVLLGLRSAVKEDLQCTAAELVYGCTLRLPGEFLSPSPVPVNDPCDFVQDLKSTMQSLEPRPASAHHRKSPFVHKELLSSTHVFVRHGGVKKPLQAPYDGPYEVIARNLKHFTIKIQGKPSTISIDRLKPCFMEHSTVSDHQPSSATPITPAEPASLRPPNAAEPSPSSSSAVPPTTTTTRSGRRVRFNPRYL
ncbi:hypothetical protein JTE90_015911 [Oedothorax gibbosus]|uniref:Integrase catalytic domain-containing protein n=1 Tax=Oedothorax gibbosus TaxID=931172 RepID=A0AAV6VV30_9ARAC|nr:hypothetical protein JTE90_015911 [Oedothorax gibbosus]